MSALTAIAARFPGLAARAAGFVMPGWAPWLAGGVAALALLGGAYGLGRVQEARIGAAALADYKVAQAQQVVTKIVTQVKVVKEVETVVRDRIVKIYVQGAKIEKAIPDYVQPVDDARFAVNAGFLRIVDAAWTGSPPGPAVDSDREPAGVPLSAVAAVEAGNATSCRAWREQALGWRDFYAKQQVVFNGKAGDWYHPPPTEEEQ